MSGPDGRAGAVAQLEHAWDLAAAGEWEQSAAAYGRLVGHPDVEVHVAALLGLAEARYRQDEEPGALQAWIAATQAPDTSNTWRAWKALAAARVREGDLAGAARSYREAERRAPADERPEIASRLGWLTKEMGQGQAAQRYFSRARTGVTPSPIATWTILAVTVGIGVSELLGNGPLWIQLFGLDKSAVADGQWWRLITVALVHDDSFFLHLAFNMYALYMVGPIIEALYGAPRFALVYVLTAAAGSAASYIASPGVDGVGASGAIFGLFGMLLVSNRVHRPALTRSARGLTGQIGMLIGLNLVLGFSIPNIDNAAHIGGLLAGAWLGFVLVPRGATLSSLWQRPGAALSGPAPGMLGAPGAGPRPPVGRDTVLRLAAVVALVAVIVLAVGLGPLGRS